MELLFSKVQQNCDDNKDHTSTTFRAAFKTSVINNSGSKHSASAICENDDTEGLNSLKEILTEVQEFSPTNEQPEIPSGFELKPNQSKMSIQKYAYIAAFVARKLLKKFGTCATCQSQLLTPTIEEQHSLIEAKDFGNMLLAYPKAGFTRLFLEVSQIIHFFLPRICAQTQLVQTLGALINKYVTDKTFTCEHHNVCIFTLYKQLHISVYLHKWITSINRILSGKFSKTWNDEMKQKAQHYYDKSVARNKKVKQTKQPTASQTNEEWDEDDSEDPSFY
ncbi:hypothetical protein V9T40_003359 [Parthenolecanium corni]|uniref:Uncharacterized protein n=1 Tax=Parthenolecanium corni TaxID=536013 RepID=A0AAN9TQJ3_9HEMI